jgi:hypothetical protein
MALRKNTPAVPCRGIAVGVEKTAFDGSFHGWNGWTSAPDNSGTKVADIAQEKQWVYGFATRG